jgi:hypothetical protein
LPAIVDTRRLVLALAGPATIAGCSLAYLDSGGADAALRDARGDALRDAGSPDARSPDARSPDARSLDVGAPADVGVDSPAPPFAPIRIACGEATPVADAEGNVWASDEYFSQGTPAVTPGQAVAGTDSPVLYDAQRYGAGGTAFSYDIPVPAGRYAVLLKFTENFATAVGDRLFDVSINGNPVLTHFDIFAASGNMDWVAVDRTFSATVGAAGRIAIDFEPVAMGNNLGNNAKVDAIAIEAAAGGADAGGDAQ